MFKTQQHCSHLMGTEIKLKKQFSYFCFHTWICLGIHIDAIHFLKTSTEITERFCHFRKQSNSSNSKTRVSNTSEQTYNFIGKRLRLITLFQLTTASGINSMPSKCSKYAVVATESDEEWNLMGYAAETIRMDRKSRLFLFKERKWVSKCYCNLHVSVNCSSNYVTSNIEVGLVIKSESIQSSSSKVWIK